MKNGLIIDKRGNKIWYKNDQYHREDGPTVELVDGSKYWHYDNQYHRLDGPAIEYPDGRKYWFYYGKYIPCNSQEEFKKIIKLRLFW